MARLFRNGVPCDADIAVSSHDPGMFGMAAHHLDRTSLSNVTIIHNGQAWRALRKTFHTQGRSIRIECTKLREIPEVQEMLLADLILN